MIAETKYRKTAAEQPIRLFTIREVAEMLSTSVRTLEKEVASGRLQPVRLRTSRRFTEEEILRFVSELTGARSANVGDGGAA